jgi:hypothetical protein
MLTLEHTDDAIKRSQNYMQRQGNDGALIMKDQLPWRRLAMTSIQRVNLRPHPTLSHFQQQLFLTNAASATAPSILQHSFVC